MSKLSEERLKEADHSRMRDESGATLVPVEEDGELTIVPFFLPDSRPTHPLIGLILAVSAVLVGVVLFLHFSKGIPIGELTRDPTAIGRLPVYTGFLSQIGIFFWSASATVCFFSLRILSRHEDRHKLKCFLFSSALLTLLLGLDDVFQLHEVVFPHFGIPEKVVFGSYAGFVLLYLFRFYPLILETEYVLMAIALFFFGVSVILDLLHPPGIDPFLFEDGAKLIGIVSWLAYFFRVGEASESRPVPVLAHVHNPVLSGLAPP